MSVLKWDEEGKKLYETGVSNGVLFVHDGSAYGKGEAWNGLTAVNESPSGAESTPLYADNVKYLNLTSSEDFGATIEAYTYPDGFAACNGEKELVKGVTVTQQNRNTFAFAYKTLIGNDTMGTNYGYKIHIIYGCTATPSEQSHNTTNESPEASTLSWTVSTTPVAVPGCKPTAHLIIDSTKVDAEKMQALLDYLWGSSSSESALPMPEKVAEICGLAG